MEPEKPEKPLDENKRCEFYVQRKRRYCKFPPVPGSKFCSAHGEDQQKIQCPYEKGMFIAASKFQKHLLNCPIVKNKQKQEGSNWFNKGVNLENDPDPKKLPSYNSVTGIDPVALMTVVHKITKLFQEEFGEEAKHYVKSTEVQKINDLTNDHTQAYLLAQAAFKAHLIKDDIIYLQFGAGKGILSYHIAEKVKSIFKTHSKNVLLERESRRNKFDRFMKDNPYFQRYKSDVSDFDVKTICEVMAQTALLKKPGLDVEKEAAELNQMQIVGICKHMCGGALDISLRALLKTKMTGCILASCCHHLCSYDTYLNREYFESKGFSPEELGIVFKISAWGTKTAKIVEETINFERLQSLPQEQLEGLNKVMIGRICKRMIDLGRAKFLNCELIRYCSDQLTPENFVIISQ